jgi:DNA polymerase III subunit gamma/tau
VNLARTLRPRTLSGLVGQTKLVEALRKQMSTRPANALLFHGTTGTGKTTIARIVAVALQCEHQKLWGDPCKECWERWNEFSITELNAADDSGKADLSSMAEMAKYEPTVGKKRVIILNEAHQMSAAAQKVLLMPTEDPPAHTVWIICTTDPRKISAELKRRFFDYKVLALGEKGVLALLERGAKKIGFTGPIADLAAKAEEHQVYSPGVLLNSLEKFASGMSAEEAVLSLESAFADTFSICKAVSSGNWSTLRGLLKKATPEEARWIRASVGGWLRGILWREANPKRADILADCIILLADGRAPLDDSSLLLWVQAVLYKVVRKLRQ